MPQLGEGLPASAGGLGVGTGSRFPQPAETMTWLLVVHVSGYIFHVGGEDLGGGGIPWRIVLAVECVALPQMVGIQQGKIQQLLGYSGEVSGVSGLYTYSVFLELSFLAW